MQIWLINAYLIDKCKYYRSIKIWKIHEYEFYLSKSNRIKSVINQCKYDGSMSVINQCKSDRSMSVINQSKSDRSKSVINQCKSDRSMTIINQCKSDRSMSVINECVLPANITSIQYHHRLRECGNEEGVTTDSWSMEMRRESPQTQGVWKWGGSDHRLREYGNEEGVTTYSGSMEARKTVTTDPWVVEARRYSPQTHGLWRPGGSHQTQGVWKPGG